MLELLTVAVFLAVLNSKIIDYLKAPIMQKWPDIDLWWVTYVALLTGIGMTWLAQINLFESWIISPVAGVLLSGVLVGGGSSLIYDVFSDRPAKVTATAERGGAISSGALEVTAAPEVTEKDEWNA
jgi:hypothetical protein